MSNSTYSPYPVKVNVATFVAPPVHRPNPARPHTISLWHEQDNIVLCVDRQNEVFTSHKLTQEKYKHIALYAQKLISQGWYCMPTSGFSGWFIVSPEKMAQMRGEL